MSRVGSSPSPVIQKTPAAKPNVAQKQTPTQTTTSSGGWLTKAGSTPATAVNLKADTLDGIKRLATQFTLLRGANRTDARERITDFFTKNPAQLDSLLATSSPDVKKAVASVLLQGWVGAGETQPGFANPQNAGRLVRLAEAIDPKASLGEVTRFLRQQYYSDEMLSVGSFSIGQRKANVSQDLELAFGGVNLKRAWQEFPGPDGKPFDFAHALVALDAQESNPTLGKLKAWVFTDFGDAASGLLSAVGLTGAGNNNPADRRGNSFGGQLMYEQRTDPAKSLSSLLERSFAPGTFLKPAPLPFTGVDSP